MKWRPFYVFPRELVKNQTYNQTKKKRFKASKIPNFDCQAFWVKPSPMLGSVHQVGRSVRWNVIWVLFVLFVVGLYISFTSLFF